MIKEDRANGPLTLPGHIVESPWESLDGRKTTSDPAHAGRAGGPGPSATAYHTPLSGGAG
jgi:hypothetical protein